MLTGLLGLGITVWAVWALFIDGPIAWSAQNIGTFLLLLFLCLFRDKMIHILKRYKLHFPFPLLSLLF